MKVDKARLKLLNMMTLNKLKELSHEEQPWNFTKSQLVNFAFVRWTDDTHAEIRDELEELLRIAK